MNMSDYMKPTVFPSPLPQELIDLFAGFDILHSASRERDGVIPHGVPGEGKRWSELTPEEDEEYAFAEVYYEDWCYYGRPGDVGEEPPDLLQRVVEAAD